jgi:hypothetical protein
VGDTVTWATHPAASIPSPSSTESYTGEWSHTFVTGGETFSYTFDQPGTYLYRAQQSPRSLVNEAGSIRVQGWTNEPPVITINTPVDGFHYTIGNLHFQILATVEKPPSEVRQVEFFAGPKFVGAATNAPYLIEVNACCHNLEVGTYNLVARVTDIHGATAVSRPVRIVMDDFESTRVFGLTLLPDHRGVFMHYTSVTVRRHCLEYSDDLKTWTGLANIFGFGSLADERPSPTGMRFYRVMICP